MTFLSLKNISKVYRKRVNRFQSTSFKVVNNVNLNVERGESIAIVGESGSGKSTLAKLIMKLEAPTAGKILLEGRTIQGMKDLQLYKKVQLVFQDSSASLPPKMQIQEVIEEAMRNFQPTFSDITSKCEALLELVGLDSSYLNRYTEQLSGGQKQRVCIARALAANPEIVLFDESIASLDQQSQESIMKQLKKIQESHQLTFLWITHDIHSIRYFCDRIEIMYQGEIVDTMHGWNPKTLSHPYAKMLFETVTTPVSQT